MEEKTWLRVEDIAKELNVAEGTVRTWIRSKKLRALRVGKDYRINREDYDKFIQENMTDGKDSKE